MALPKLNESPSYPVTIPSSGQETTFRPFLVKEQKALLIAYETQEKSDIVRAIVRTIHACVEEPVTSKLTTFDVDYLFTKIRAKSVGETADLIVSCTHCDADNEVTVDLDGITMEGSVQDSAIEVTDSVSVKMRYPTYEEFLSNPVLVESESVTERMMELLIICMEAVLTEDERIDLVDETKESVMEFLESMTSEQFDRLSEFVNTAPAIKQDVAFTCTSCKKKNTHELRGIDDFF